MPKLYYAGPLFTDAERLWNNANVTWLRAHCPAWTVLMPQEFCAAFDGGVAGKPDFARVYRACVDHLASADVVLAILDGADADSGTSFEMGYAVARGIPIIGLRTDWRPAEDGSGNCMLSRSCRQVIKSIEEMSSLLAQVKK
jgi:nucleoside 2-deoxyribosyltransferase